MPWNFISTCEVWAKESDTHARAPGGTSDRLAIAQARLCLFAALRCALANFFAPFRRCLAALL